VNDRNDPIADKLARLHARDEVEELVWERAVELAKAEGSQAFGPLHDEPQDQQDRRDFQARVRVELGRPCCDRYGIGDHDSVEHGGRPL
jgi:hypothetical protein